MTKKGVCYTMKICNLKIYNKNNEEIRNIIFNENGISFIFGDIEKPQDKQKTSNSIGKTLLLKLVDYILGANEDKDIVKKDIYDYSICATVIYNEVKYIVKRKLGNSSSISINDDNKTLDEYKRFFNLDRNLIAHQVILGKKQSLISLFPQPNLNDYEAVLNLLQLVDICNCIQKIFKLQDQYKSVNSNKKQLLSMLNIQSNNVDNEVFFNEKDIDDLTAKINAVNEEIRGLRLNSENELAQAQYAKINEDVKSLRLQIFELLTEKTSLEKYVAESSRTSIDGDSIKKIYKRVKIELPSVIIKSIEEVDAFYKAICEDRLSKVQQRIHQIEILLQELNNNVTKKEETLDKLGTILSTNDAYKNALEILHTYTNNMQELKYKQGQLSQVLEFIKESDSINNELLSEFSILGTLKENFEEEHKKYKNFVYGLVGKIYDPSVRASFEIVLKKYDKKARPINISMEITGDAGEGVKEVKKAIMDYLLFNYSNKLDIFIHDSACYNGIDPRQISGLLKELMTMAEQNKKQVIVSINKYQLDDESIIKAIEENACITLSETNKLLLCDF